MGVKSRGIREPKKPSKAEVDEHNLDHIPFRTWCKHCMRGKSKSAPHKSSEVTGEERGKPVISFDYCFMGTNRKGTKEERETERAQYSMGRVMYAD